MECKRNSDGKSFTITPDDGYEITAIFVAQHNPQLNVTNFSHGSRLKDDGSQYFVYSGMAEYVIGMTEQSHNPYSNPTKENGDASQDS